MAIQLESAADFARTLQEVDVLVDLADQWVDDEARYAALNKAALLLLAGKFENFAEVLAEDYVFAVNQLRPPMNAIPRVLRLQHTFKALKSVGQLTDAARHDEAERVFADVGALWGRNAEFTPLNIDCKFSYGKHGEIELRKLFATIGIADVFQVVTVTRPAEQLTGDANGEDAAEASGVEVVDFKGVFNSVTNIRNNILHQDASPGLTSTAIRGYREAFRQFAVGIAAFLSASLDALAVACAQHKEEGTQE